MYYKELKTLILAYGISETSEFGESWPAEIMNSSTTIRAYFDKEIPRYGDSFVFKAYKIAFNGAGVSIENTATSLPIPDLEIDENFKTITNYYKSIFSDTSIQTKPESLAIVADYKKGLFYMEKQLEDFIIHNWDNTPLGKRFNLIIEDGEPISQQYRTDIGPIDILTIDKETGSYVVIELKRNQTSDETVGQLCRYMGWIKVEKKDNNVRGVIIAGSFDKKLDYALKAVSGIEVFLYEIDFKLKDFKN